jgi:hypothetical protein
MSLTIKNPEALSWKYSNTEGICTRGGEITQLPDSIVLDQAACDAIDAEFQAHLDATAYIDKRANEYPPMTDYLDAWVKEDTVALDKYRADCLAVKAKHSK